MEVKLTLFKTLSFIVKYDYKNIQNIVCYLEVNQMEWTEFCEKVSRMLRPWKKRLQCDYNDNRIVYTIATQEYEYTIDDKL